MNRQLCVIEDGAALTLSELIGKDSGRVLLVCGKSFTKTEAFKRLSDEYSDLVVFSDFQPNPELSSAVLGTELLKKKGCGCIVAAGGGSAIDVAKCIKRFARIKNQSDYLTAPPTPNSIRFIAVPTTAGSGSEATRFAVIYNSGTKLTVTDETFIPDTTILDSELLLTLPPYQKSSTAFDALSHAVESCWSVKADDESQSFAADALRLIAKNVDSYLNNEKTACAEMLKASYLAGQAINISQTTAAHAMAYVPTKRLNIAHGHACGLVLPKLWKYMLENLNDDNSTASDGYAATKKAWDMISEALYCEDYEKAIAWIEALMSRAALTVPAVDSALLNHFVENVNVQRLGNTPMRLASDDILAIYSASYNI